MLRLLISALVTMGFLIWCLPGSDDRSDAAGMSGGIRVINNTQISAPVPFTPLHMFFVSATGDDTKNGLTTATAWATPNHAVNCGDVVLANPVNYAAMVSNFGAVSNCPSTSGGIDGTGGINFAILLCAGSFPGACTINNACTGTGVVPGMEINTSNWAIEGWSIKQGYSTTCSGFGYDINGGGTANGGSNSVLHHIAWVNNLSINNASGYTINSYGASDPSFPSGQFVGYGADYIGVVGNIAQDSAGRCDGFSDGAIDMIGIGNFDSVSGTHIYIDGNFSFNNQQTAGPNCGPPPGTDGESMLFDTIDALQYARKIVVRNNILAYAERYGLLFTYSQESSSVPNIYVYNNTLFANNVQKFTTGGAGGNYGEIDIGGSDAAPAYPWNTFVYNNISRTEWACGNNNCSTNGFLYAFGVEGLLSASPPIENGNVSPNPSNSQNIYRAVVGACHYANCDAGSNIGTSGTTGTLGVNTYSDPTFNNTTDWLANRIGVPNCNGVPNTVQCLGYNANIGTLANPSFIYDLLPTSTFTTKGYQLPKACVGSDPDFPTWMKGIIYLKASGWVNAATITMNSGLITKPCGY